MLKYLIQVVQNCTTLVVLLALFYALVNLTENRQQRRWMRWGFFAGTAAALLFAVLDYTTKLINREFFLIGLLLVALLLECVFCLFAWGVLWRKRLPLRELLWSINGGLMVALLLLSILPDILLYPTQFVLMGESVFSTDFLFKGIGYLLGLTLVALSGIALYHASASLSYKTVRVFTTVALLLHMVPQIVAIVQPLVARRIIPMPRWLFQIIKLVVNNSSLFLYLLLGLAALLPVLAWIKSRKAKGEFANSAQHRKFRAGERRKRRWSALVLSCFALVLLTLTTVKAYAEQSVQLSPAEPMSIEGDKIKIPLESVSDGALHRYAFQASDGTEVRFIVIQKSSASYGVGLDACDICGPTGYYQRGDEVICKLCDVVMNISTIGFKGGCNPVPLQYSLDSGTMIIDTQNLENEKKRFA